MYDRGTYIGTFRSFDVEETDDQPFAFKVSWTFKVEEELMKLPNLTGNPQGRGSSAPAFQNQNALQSNNTIPGSPNTPASIVANANQASFSQRSADLNTALQGTSGATPQIQSLVTQANQAQQQGDYVTAFQRLSQASQAANQLPAASSPTQPGRK
jgi:hypothetical protein